MLAMCLVVEVAACQLPLLSWTYVPHPQHCTTLSKHVIVIVVARTLTSFATCFAVDVAAVVGVAA